MGRINYTAILKGIEQVLRNDGDVIAFNADVLIQKPVPTTLTEPVINVFEDRRDPTPGQDIAVGTRKRYTIRWAVWVTCFSSNSYADAAEQRDELLGKVEIALMKNRTLDGVLPNASLDIQGGELGRGGPAGDVGFIAQSTLVVTAEAVASTV